MVARLQARLTGVENSETLGNAEALWRELRTSVENAFEFQKPLRTKDLAQALKQVRWTG